MSSTFTFSVCSAHVSDKVVATSRNASASAFCRYLLYNIVIVSRILYALPAWGSFLIAELTNRINAFFRRDKQFGYIATVLTVDEILSQSEYDLFVKTSIPGQPLHNLLPPYSSNLREHGHSFHLPDYDTVLFKKSFIVRSLYKFVTSNY